MKLARAVVLKLEEMSRRLRITGRERLMWRGRHHRLGLRVIVSLTSYPPRYPTLHLTLRCLLSQSVYPDSLILWLAKPDVELLPRAVSDLCSQGLQIRTCEDVRSYKKIFPVVIENPDAIVITADDDTFYWHRWLEGLLRAYADPKEVLCYRARRIGFDANGGLLPYRAWPLGRGGERSPLLLPTGVGGVLYPPGVISTTANDPREYLAYCPSGDDIWLYWHALNGGATVRQVHGRGSLRPWLRSQSANLTELNVRLGGNDRQLNAMIKAYGRPRPWPYHVVALPPRQRAAAN
jgi:hypothetical protein